MALLELREATMRFGGLVAVNKFSMEVKEHEIVSLIGPNGAGKTTAFNMITGIYCIPEGEIYFDGKEITRLKPNEIVELGISRTFQNVRLFKIFVLSKMLLSVHILVLIILLWICFSILKNTGNKKQLAIKNQLRCYPPLA